MAGTDMAKSLYSAAMSADGFIAGPGGDLSWLDGEGEGEAFGGRCHLRRRYSCRRTRLR
ncbi:hypothetical protein GGC64_004456 [Mycobacterium sp. OAS707]|nr:hypothetical protein [Mycobacterium sp. OAS707]